MRERPRIFNGPMVQAILEDRKTQTRRPIKGLDGSQWELNLLKAGRWREAILCPWEVGDRLWVRETWFSDESDLQYARTKHEDVMSLSPIYYKADEVDPYIFPKWRPSIFMPRWASRVTLDILDLRVERLQEISEEDAECEGMDSHCPEDKMTWATPREQFIKFWDSLYVKKGFGWNENPWVWVIEFRRLNGGQDEAVRREG